MAPRKAASAPRTAPKTPAKPKAAPNRKAAPKATPRPGTSAPAKLGEYERKRDFGKTPEPGPAPQGRPAWAGDKLAYVIHEHHARALHFDLRLEWEGVLLSWAVPKGPSLDPKDKRLAVHVEDHPLEYGTFEGEIPKGEYGAGQVILWDCGTWEPIQDPGETLPHGELKFIIHGVKLTGAWMLVRMKPRPGEKRENWLLFKERDDAARAGFDTLGELPGSVSDRCAGGSTPPGGDAQAGASSAGARPARAGAPGEPGPARAAVPVPDPATLPGARKAPMPEAVSPMLATLSDHTPAGEGWLHEIKYDGYRAMARLDASGVRMLSRNGLDWTAKFAPVADAVAGLPARSALIDGEVAVVGSTGVSDFGSLQEALSTGDLRKLTYFAFDLLYLDGYDLTKAPLAERKRALAALLSSSPDYEPLRFSEHVEGGGEAFHRRACEFALEGVVSKRADSAYVQGRSRAWIKSKCGMRQEFVVVGFTEGAGAREKLGALLVGYHDVPAPGAAGPGPLRLAGRVGTGFDDATVTALSEALRTIETPDPPVADPPTGRAARGMHWVAPVLVAEVAFAEWTRDGVLRQPVFKGLRDDKDPDDVVREDTAAGGAAGAEPAPEGTDSGTPVAAPRSAKPVVAGGDEDAAPTPPTADASRPVRVHGVKLTHPDRQLFEDSSITKLELAQYYVAVAGVMLPYAVGRPITVMRCPHGMAEECFYQRHIGDPIPKHVRSVVVPGLKATEGFIVVDSLTGLLELVQLGALEFHAWGAKAKDPDHPDRLVWDLDPDPEIPFADVADAARLVRMRVESLGLAAFLDTTGGKGLHVVTPIVPDLPWGPAEAFARALAEDVARVSPRKFTTNMRKDKRTGGIFLDYVRNTKTSSAIVPYSARARSGGPVCTPLTWDELDAFGSAPHFLPADVAERVTSLPDPWAGYGRARRKITKKALSVLGLEV